MQKIYDFKRGDFITRVLPCKDIGDRSYMGDKLTFIGIANGQIYFKNNSKFMTSLLGENYIHNVSLDIWDEGWVAYIDPETLLEGSENIISSLSIEQQIQEAVNNEDYELAEKLKKRLNK